MADRQFWIELGSDDELKNAITRAHEFACEQTNTYTDEFLQITDRTCVFIGVSENSTRNLPAGIGQVDVPELRKPIKLQLISDFSIRAVQTYLYEIVHRKEYSVEFRFEVALFIYGLAYTTGMTLDQLFDVAGHSFTYMVALGMSYSRGERSFGNLTMVERQMWHIMKGPVYRGMQKMQLHKSAKKC